MGRPDEPGTQELLAVAAGGFHPARVVARAPDPSTSAVALLAERVRLRDRPTAYVCRNFACQVPVTDADALEAQLRERSAAL